MAKEFKIPTTDPTVIEENVKKWYLKNIDKYSEFRKQANGVSKMNFAFFINLMKFVTDCIPKDKMDVCSYIFLLGCGNILSDEDTPDFIKQYDDVLEEFLKGGKILTINISNSEVKCFAPEADFTPDDNVCVVSNDHFDRMKAERPELLRCYLDDLYEQLDEEWQFEEGEGGIRNSEMFLDMLQKIAYEKKNTWEETAEAEPEESASYIRQLLWKIKCFGGKRKTRCLSLDELLIGDIEKLKRIIKAFRLHQRDSVSLGYLFYLLDGRPTEKTRSTSGQEGIDEDFRFVRKQHIKQCTFKAFCAAVLAFTNEELITDLKRA